jgi:lysophospholipase L1-like esterase
VIRTEAKRWPSVRVVDWNAHSRGRPWFREDGLHLNAAGAVALARLLRGDVLRAANPG